MIVAKGGCVTVKVNWNKKYTTIMIYAMIVILALVLVAFLLMDLPAVWQKTKALLANLAPIFYGAIFAYLLAPFINFLERRIFRGIKKPRLKRAFSIIVTYIVALVGLALFVWQVIPKVMRGYSELQTMAGWYLEAVSAWLLDLSIVDGLLSGYLTTVTEYAVELLTEIYHALGLVVPDIGSVVGAAVGIVMDVLLGIMLSVYYLASKEKLLAQMKKLSHALFRKRRYKNFAKTANLANKNFGGYIKGQLADALILGAVCYICSMVIGIPYYPLISMLVGLCSVIPVVGPWIGTVAGALIVLLADPLSMLWFVILMICLIFLNGRLIKPRVIRAGVEASSIFMFTALLIAAGLFGFWGLILGVPIFTILYALLHSLVDHKLSKKGYMTDIYAYYSDETGRELHIEEEFRRAKQASGTLFGAPRKRQDALFTEEFPAMPDSSEYPIIPDSGEFPKMETSEMPAMKTEEFAVYSETIATDKGAITSEIPVPKDLEDPKN